MSPNRDQTTISISRKNHELLIDLEKKGQSFNDILTSVLERKKGSGNVVMADHQNQDYEIRKLANSND
jgi:predicted CopG family antitoxin